MKYLDLHIFFNFFNFSFIYFLIHIIIDIFDHMLYKSFNFLQKRIRKTDIYIIFFFLKKIYSPQPNVSHEL